MDARPPVAGGDPFRFPFCRPVVPQGHALLRELEPSFGERRLSNSGPAVRRLEARIDERWAPPGRVAVTVASGTSGIAAALIALDVRGLVAIPAFTFAATASAVEQAGCTPVLCDVDETTWELDPADAADTVRRRGCVALVHVRAFGLCRGLEPIEAVAAAAGIPLVVDAAAAFGGCLDDGTPIGGAGDAEVVSFHATKAFCAGEGGAVLAGQALARRVHEVANFGFDDRVPRWRGLNAKMSELTGAMACAVEHDYGLALAARRAAAGRLGEAAQAGGASLPASPGAPPWPALPVLVRDEITRDASIAALSARGLEARAYYHPGLHQTPAYAGYADRPLPVSEGLSERILCLPVYADCTAGELDELCDIVATALRAPGA